MIGEHARLVLAVGAWLSYCVSASQTVSVANSKSELPVPSAMMYCVLLAVV